MKCCCFGSLNMDHIYRVAEFVQPGETRKVTALNHVCGGKGLNQSLALAAGGAQVLPAGNVGDNADGDHLAAALAARGLDTGLVRRLPDCECGHGIIQVTDRGENCILYYAGANERVDARQIDEVLSYLDPGDLLVLQNEINDPLTLVRAAKARGRRVALNPSPCNALITPALLSLVDILFVNEVEARQLAGPADADEAAGAALHARYPGALLVQTLGARGAVAFQGDAVYQQPAFPVQAVDTTAAGDTFTGFFLSAWMAGGDLPACLRLAARAAALCVTRLGASVSIPSLAEVQAWQG